MQTEMSTRKSDTDSLGNAIYSLYKDEKSDMKSYPQMVTGDVAITFTPRMTDAEAHM